jgi:hypothetical protein
MKSGKRLLATSISFMVILYFLFFYMGAKIIAYPGPEKEAEEDKYEESGPFLSDFIAPRLRGDEAGARQIQKKWRESGDIHEKLLKEYNKIRPFRKPRHNMITREQVDRFYNIWKTCAEEYKEFKRTHLPKPPGFFKVLALYAYIPVMFENCAKRGLIEQQMTEEEYDWVSQQLKEAALFACNCKWEMRSGTEAEREHLKNIRERLARMLEGLYEEKEGEMKYYPERLKEEHIPQCNVALFLEMKEKARWTRVDFASVSFDEEAIMKRAAQRLPPCPP